MPSTRRARISSSGGTSWPPRAVVELAAVVVGMVVAGGDVEPAVRAQPADRERELGRGHAVRRLGPDHVHAHAVGGVDARGEAREIGRGQAQQRVGQRRVVHAAHVAEDAHVEGDDDRHLLARVGLAQDLRVALHRGAQRPRVEAVGAQPHRAAPPARAERDDLPEHVHQRLEAPLAHQRLELGAPGGEALVQQPRAQGGQRAALHLGVHGKTLDAVAGQGLQRAHGAGLRGNDAPVWGRPRANQGMAGRRLRRARRGGG